MTHLGFKSLVHVHCGILLVLSSACGKDDKKSEDGAAVTSQLDGTWSKACEDGFSTTLTLKGKESQFTSTEYADKACAPGKATVTTRDAGTVTSTDKDLSITTTKYYRKPENAESVATLSGDCPDVKWELKKETESSSCVKLDKDKVGGVASYQYKINGDVLTLSVAGSTGGFEFRRK